MTRYALELSTLPGVADSDYVDRLADIVYELDGLIDPLLALNNDGSITASFEVEAPDLFSATRQAVPPFAEAFDAAKPLRDADGAVALGKLAISAAGDRAAASAS